jgi:rhodanese-related sulfurtransferase/glyoxylase-like metal-dependent hydrolase (beta-lactamase superfamily II)
MWLKQLIRDESGCATYLIGAENGDCLVFDPLWDIGPYLEIADKQGARIRYAVDSHTHADHISGARRLADATGAELILPLEAEAEFAARRISDGDRIEMGEVLFETVHVPGHRPEQINLLVTDRSRGVLPWCLLTADFVLVGDIARPDLAQSGEAGAQVIFDWSLPRIAALPDFVEVYPGHVAGSTCGRVTSGKHATTLGYERRFNPAMTIADREAFVRYLNHGQPARPANVENIVAINQGRQPYAFELPSITPISPVDLAEQLAADAVFVVDTRDAAMYGEAHIPGSVNVQLSESQFEQRLGWVRPGGLPMVLVGTADGDARAALSKLAFVGLEGSVKGYLEGGLEGWADAGMDLDRLDQIEPEEVWERLSQGEAGFQAILDVRDPDEWEAGHLSGSVRISYKDLQRDLETLNLDPGRPVLVYCGAGNRSTTAGSILKRRRFENVINLNGGLDGWRAAGLPVE